MSNKKLEATLEKFAKEHNYDTNTVSIAYANGHVLSFLFHNKNTIISVIVGSRYGRSTEILCGRNDKEGFYPEYISVNEVGGILALVANIMGEDDLWFEECEQDCSGPNEYTLKRLKDTLKRLPDKMRIEIIYRVLSKIENTDKASIGSILYKYNTNFGIFPEFADWSYGWKSVDDFLNWFYGSSYTDYVTKLD